MSRGFRLYGAAFFGFLLMTTGLVTLALPDQVAMGLAAPAATQAEPAGGFVADGSTVNSNNQNGLTPALAIKPSTGEPWVALAQNNRVLATKFVTATQSWAQQDGALNRSLANVATTPSLAFAGVNHDQAWVAWSESIGGVQQIMASWFNGASWVTTPGLNHDPQQHAENPMLTVGATISGALPLPWVSWAEMASNGKHQIVVSRAMVDASAQGGYRWQPVVDALNFDPARDGHEPDLAFAGAGTVTPWIVWRETGADAIGHIFAKVAITESWQSVGRQESCGNNEVACALNLDPQRDAQRPRLAAGTLPNEASATPWVVFAEQSATGIYEVRVLRLDIGSPADSTDDRFTPVGGSVNTQCLGQGNVSVQGGIQPDIYFVGHVPHVTWVEGVGSGGQLFVCHLADAQPGQERWDLDSISPLNRAATTLASAPSLSTDGNTPYVSWQEGITPTNVLVAHRYPAGPAWGNNYPPKVRNISLLDSATAATLPPDVQTASTGDDEAALARSMPVAITTVANHVNGWEHLQEIQFKLVNGDQVPFLVRYVRSENKVYVQDPDHPGVFLPGVTPGPGAPSIPGRFVTLVTPSMSIVNHGGGSAALDIRWLLIFEDATFLQTYTQAINLLYDEGKTTGFFSVGDVFVGHQTFLPTIVNQL